MNTERHPCKSWVREGLERRGAGIEFGDTERVTSPFFFFYKWSRFSFAFFYAFLCLLSFPKALSHAYASLNKSHKIKAHQNHQALMPVCKI